MADENIFGDWLRSKRDAKGWTQQELAERSGVSGQQISNIEIGRSPNPRAATRERLQRALEAEAPARVVEKAEAEQRIPNLGVLQDFDPYADDLPECSGVYVFYDITDRPVYVGKTTERNIGARVKEHHEKFWFKRPVVTHGAYIEIADADLCGKIEQVLIKFLKSNAVFNKQYVERG